MNHHEQRERLRAILAGRQCVATASVYDPISALIAQSVGYEIGQVGGSIAAAAILAAPDLIVLTLTEFAEQMRRIARVADLCLFVDADHGYGNALNVMRTIEELEHAGVSGLTIEDTALPLAYGQPRDEIRLLSIEEGAGKMRAAVAARTDPGFVIGARTSALRTEGLEGAISRVRMYAACGVDAIFLEGFEKLEHLEALHDAARIPMILGNNRMGHKREDLAARGARIQLNPHLPIAATVHALKEVYTHLYRGGAPDALKAMVASPADMEKLVHNDDYKRWLRQYMDG
jgi:carboxyvinyl-carboxyphosphonate phosphorylmutase